MIADAEVESVVDDRATTGGDDGLGLARWSDQAAWGRAPSCDDARVSEDVVAVAPLLARARCAGAPRVASDTIARPSEAPRCIERLAGPIVACDEVYARPSQRRSERSIEV